jgi:hypothetical protein
MEKKWKGLGLAIGQLTPTDRDALLKTITDFLTSKGIDPAKYAEKRDEIKEVRKETRVEIKEGKEELKDTRKKLREDAKAKREEMREKIKTIRGNGNDFNSSRSNRETGN